MIRKNIWGSVSNVEEVKKDWVHGDKAIETIDEKGNKVIVVREKTSDQGYYELAKARYLDMNKRA